MQIPIDFVDMDSLQVTLNNTFGDGIFTVVVDKNTDPKSYYMYCADNTPQNSVDEATVLAQQNATEMLNSIKINLYNQLQGKVDKAILSKEKPRFNDVEIEEANIWLQDMAEPPPTCVLFLALSLSITNEAAAQQIVTSKSSYENYILQINTIKSVAQGQVLSSTDVFSAKNIATTAIAEIKNVA